MTKFKSLYLVATSLILASCVGGDGGTTGDEDQLMSSALTGPIVSNKIFADAMAPGWKLNAWKWGITSASVTSVDKFAGTSAVLAQAQSAWSGVTFDSLDASGSALSVSLSDLNSISFYIKPKGNLSSAHQGLKFLIKDNKSNVESTQITISTYVDGILKAGGLLQADTWSLIKIPKSELIKTGLTQFNQIVFFNASASTLVEFYLDDVSIDKTAIATTPVDPAPAPAPEPVTSESIFADQLHGNWSSSWSWNSAVAVDTTNKYFKITATQGWGGFVLARVNSQGAADMIPADKYTAVSFDINMLGTTLSAGHQALQASLNNDSTGMNGVKIFDPKYIGTQTAGTNKWLRVRIPIKDMNPKSLPFHQFVVYNNSSTIGFAYLIDNVSYELVTSTPVIIAPTPTPAPAPAPVPAPGNVVAGASGCQNLAIAPAFQVGTYVTDHYTWFDSRCKARTASLVRTHAKGGHAKQFSYVLDNGTKRTINENASVSAAGFGYVVSHLANAGLAIGGDSPLGSNLNSSYRVVYQGANHAIHEFKTNYPRYGAGQVKYNMPVTIHWFFATGRDYPLWSVTMDLSAAPNNAVQADTRAPYGDMLFDGSVNAWGDSIGGLLWGSKYHFNTIGSPYKLNSEWDFSKLNTGAPYNGLWTQTTDAEMGIVGTRTMKNQPHGGYSGASTKYFGKTSAAGVTCTGLHTMPCSSDWPFQSISWSIPTSTPNATTASKRLAWGSDYFLGKPTHTTLNNSTVVSGWPKLSYAVYITLDSHSKGPTFQMSRQAEVVESTDLTATLGTVRLKGAPGVGREADVAETYSPAGYNPYYGTWEVNASTNAVNLSFNVKTGQLVNPVLVINGYTAASFPTAVKLNGLALVSGKDYFISLDSVGKKVWLTLNSKLSGGNTISVSP